MPHVSASVLVVITLAYLFDFLNGMHDSANSIATIVSTRVLAPKHAVIGLGTLMGGWKIVHTMGNKVTKLKPVGGFCAETGAGLSILICSYLGVPVSTTHTITGAIVGVGATQRFSAVRWGVAGRILYAWLLTIPMSGAIGAISYAILSAVVR